MSRNRTTFQKGHEVPLEWRNKLSKLNKEKPHIKQLLAMWEKNCELAKNRILVAKEQGLITDYQSGYSLKNLCKKYKLSYNSVKGCLISENVSPPKKQFFKERVTVDGYIAIWKPKYYRARKDGYVLEHILIWEQVHNRQLPEGWIIHHLNGIKVDNRPENLVAMKRGKHIDLAIPYKKRIRELELKINLLERALDSQQIIWWTEN